MDEEEGEEEEEDREEESPAPSFRLSGLPRSLSTSPSLDAGLVQ